MGFLSRLLILFVCIIPKRWCLLPETNTHYTDPMWQKISRESRRYADISFLTFQFLSALLISILMLGALVLNKVSLVWLIGGTYINHSVRLEIWYVEDWPPYCNNTFQTKYVLWKDKIVQYMNTYFLPSQVCGIWTCVNCTRGCGFNKSVMEYEFYQKNTNASMAQWSCAVCRMYKLNFIPISPENTINFQEFSLLPIVPWRLRKQISTN